MDATESHNLPSEIQVWPSGQTPGASPEDGEFPRLTYYLPSDEYRSGQSVLVLPGGGYHMVSSAKEGHRPAQLLAAHGLAAAVLEYRHAPQRHPIPLIDAQRALRLMRERAGQTDGLNPDAVGCLGFSAGGHLAGALATQPAVDDGDLGDSASAIACRPDFFALIYPVVSLVAECAHTGSRDGLLGPEADPTLAQALSIERAVTADTPPCFIAQGQNDAATVPENAILLYQSLTRCGRPATMHLYDDLPHGVGLAANHPWGRALLDWLDRLSPHRA